MSAEARIRDSDFEEYPTALASRIASAFDIPAPVETYDFAEKGNINRHTYRVTGGTGPACGDFLLQQINPHVFRSPPSVMDAMIACIHAQRRTLQSRPPGSGPWETIELMPTRSGAPYLTLEDLRGLSYWRLMRRIPESRTFKSLGEIASREGQQRAAREAGRGLALFGDLTSGMDAGALVPPLPGYRDTDLYYRQLDAVLRGARTLEECGDLLPADPLVRESTAAHFVVHAAPDEYRRRLQRPGVQRALEQALGHRAFALTLRRAMDEGRIRTVAIHGDTKLDNFLFDTTTGQAKALVDLDTIMPHTWLTDWGDMVRSLCNVAGEKESDPERIRFDGEIFTAIAEGFLSTAMTIRDEEVAMMVDAVRILALELGIRFLADYLRGDSYFKLGTTDPGDLNRIRGLCQITLFERIGEDEAQWRGTVERLRAGDPARQRGSAR